MDTPTPKHMGRWWGDRRLHGYANSKTYGEMVGWQEIAWIRQLQNIWGDGGVAGDCMDLPNIWGDGGVVGDCMDTPTPEHMGRWWGDRRLHGYANSRTYGEMMGWQEIDGYANSRTYGEMVG